MTPPRRWTRHGIEPSRRSAAQRRTAPRCAALLAGAEAPAQATALGPGCSGGIRPLQRTVRLARVRLRPRARLWYPSEATAASASPLRARCKQARCARPAHAHELTHPLPQDRGPGQDLPRVHRAGVRRREFRHCEGRVRLHHRPQRLRQDHHPQRARRPGAGQRRPCVHGRPRGRRTEPGAWRGVPGPCADALAQRAPQHCLRGAQQVARLDRTPGRRAGREVRDDGRPGARHRQEAGGAVGRHEAARGHRARLRDRAQDAAARRTLRCARRADARQHPGRTAEDLRRDAPDRLHDHARRRRGHPAGRQDPADEQRPAGARGGDRAQHHAARPPARHAAPRPAVLPHPQPPGRLPRRALEGPGARSCAGVSAEVHPGVDASPEADTEPAALVTGVASPNRVPLQRVV